MTSRNQKYEQKLKTQGLKKITVWVPESSVPEFKLMAAYCCDNPESIPFMVRDMRSGRMNKAV